MVYYDVVIVGAGPGGLRCAEVLAQEGKKVLLLEKNKVIGPKVCGGGLTAKDLEGIGLPESLVDRKFKEGVLCTSRYSSSFKSRRFFVCTVNREVLGQWQLKKVKKTKAKVRTCAEVTEIGKDYVVINNKEKVNFGYLVGSDGSPSIVRRYLGVKTVRVGVAVQYNIKSKKYNELELFMDSKLFKAWYGWIFPHKDYVLVGCGGYPRWFPTKKMSDNLELWIKQKGISLENSTYQAHTINADYRGYKFGNIFLVGDAAGLTPGATGKGVYPAVLSGEEVAKSILCPGYESKKIKSLARLVKRQNNFVTFLMFVGPFRSVIFDLLVLGLRNKRFEDFVMRKYLE